MKIRMILISTLLIGMILISTLLICTNILNADQKSNPLVFEVDAGAQVDNTQVFQHVEKVWHHKKWENHPQGWQASPEWLMEREEGMMRWMSGDYYMNDPFKNHRIDADGNFHFVPPDPRGPAELDKWAGHPEVKPWVNIGTAGIPAPLIEGGFVTGTYHYNVRQPNDYAKWQHFLESQFQWLVDRYGRSEVKQWLFLFGFESDWQTKCVYPGTTNLMSKADNRREFIKMMDYFQAAAENVLGKGAQTGCYFALITQADDYFKHWATGTNFVTGEIGTRVGFVGFSDWYHISTKPAGDWYDPIEYQMSPFTEAQGGGDQPAASMAYHGGMMFKYKYLERLFEKYPPLDDLEVYINESGYIQVGSSYPAPLTFANYYGANLYTLRTIAFSHMPRIKAAANNFALCVGDRAGSWPDDVKPPVFNAHRIQMNMAGERVLPIEQSGKQTAETEIRVAASASATENLIRIAAVNFNYLFHTLPEPKESNTQKMTLKISGLPPVESVSVTPYLIDENHNNWWKDWREFRAEKELPFVTKDYGVWAKYHPFYQPYVNDIAGTVRKEDYPVWEARQKKYREMDDLTPTGSPKTVKVANGTAEIPITLTESATAYLEIRYDFDEPDYGTNLSFERALDGWHIEGNAVSFDRMVKIAYGENGGLVQQKLTGLQPNAVYTVSAETRCSARKMDAGLFARTAGTKDLVQAHGNRSCIWNRICITQQSNADGELLIGMQVPEQSVDAEDFALFRNLTVKRSF
jgi:hypothetical protein